MNQKNKKNPKSIAGKRKIKGNKRGKGKNNGISKGLFSTLCGYMTRVGLVANEVN